MNQSKQVNILLFVRILRENNDPDKIDILKNKITKLKKKNSKRKKKQLDFHFTTIYK